MENEQPEQSQEQPTQDSGLQTPQPDQPVPTEEEREARGVQRPAKRDHEAEEAQRQAELDAQRQEHNERTDGVHSSDE